MFIITASIELIAQEKSQIVPGSRIRVLALDSTSDWIKGSLLSLDVDTLALKVKSLDTAMIIPVSSITKLEVSKGRKSRWLTGLAIGTISGALTVGLIFSQEAGKESQTAGTYFLEGAVVGGLVFGAIGTGIGALIKTERWEKVPLEKISMNLMPNNRGDLLFSILLNF